MRVPLDWLKEFVTPLGDAAAVARALTMAGIGVEAVEGDVLVLEITSNRADLLSMAGVARDLALLTGATLKLPAIRLVEGKDAPGVAVEVADKARCPRYAARVVRGVKIGPAPLAIQKRLAAALGDDYEPVNNVADITNFVMLELGQPLHAFDLRHVRGNRIVVRPAKKGEKLVAINGKDYALEPGDIAIADAERPLAIAGVMGGKESEITAATTDVLIESAMFDPPSIRRTSRRLGLTSESCYRFERGVDWDGVDRASERAAQLIAEHAGGTVAKGVVDVSVPRPARAEITLRLDRARRLLGVETSAARARQILEGLGAAVKSSDAAGFRVAPPPHRRDISIEADLIEELARVDGYDKIPTDVQLGLSVARDNPDEQVRQEIRSTLAGLGAFEVLTWSFEEATASAAVPFWSAGKLLPLRNPKGHVDRTLRSALAPALLKVLRLNEGCGEALHPIFEVATAYLELADADHPGEKLVVGLAHPDGIAGVRAMTRALLDRLQVAWSSAPLAAPWIAAGETIAIGGSPAGFLGRIDRFGVAELDFAALAKAATLVRKASAYSIHPAVRRDLSLSFPKETAWPAVEAAVRALKLPNLRDVVYLDHFEGKQVGEGRRSISLSLTFLAPDRTLAGPEVDAAVKAVVGALESALGGKLR